MADAKVYQKTPQDKVVILNVRGFYLQPFVAPNWVDLRVGFFLSLTSALSDDTTTGLGETIPDTTGQGVPLSDHYFIGVLNQANFAVSILFTNFIGPPGSNRPGDSALVSSDIGLGTTNANLWRPKNGNNDSYAAVISDAGSLKAIASDGVQQHFPQDPAGAGGYAVLLGLQLLRDNAQSRTLRVNIKSSGHSADMLYTNTPTLDVLHGALEAWPPSQQMGQVTLSAVPDAFYFYWPFHNSRLRIHAHGVLKAK